MVKLGRNSLCPCGSGKKYKKCCLGLKKDRKASASSTRFVPVYTELDQLSNSVMELINKDKLDEAEKTGKKLLKEYPDQIDGFHRLAQVYEAKKEKTKAVKYYQKAADFAKTEEGFDKESVQWFLSQIERLKKE